jgi:hypothetical protein
MITEISVAVIGAVAAITVSLVSFIVAVTSAVIAKEQKVSEFRQAWINELRLDIAVTFNSAKSCIFYLECCNKAFVDKKDDKEHLDLYNNSISELELKQALIRLKLNPVKDKVFIKINSSIIESLSEIEYKKGDDNFNSQREIALKNINKFTVESHSILKNEWERVKVGEKLFVRYRSIGELCLFAFISAILSSISVYLLLIIVIKFPEYFPGIN